MPAISALRRLRPEVWEFEASLDYITGLYLNKNKKNNRMT
jgi:hypothetical protein